MIRFAARDSTCGARNSKCTAGAMKSFTSQYSGVPVTTVADSTCVTAPGMSEPRTRSPQPTIGWFSSFGQADPQPDNDTVDTDAAGKPRAFGVNGANGTAIPGDIRGKVTETSANSENTGAGEVVANLVDGSTDTKWLAWTPTAW